MKSHRNVRLRMMLGVAVIAAAAALTLTFNAEASTIGTSGASYTHQTAPTRFVDVGGARLAYRRFGQPGSVPLVFFQHFVGNMDSWDPAVVDGLAKGREVVIFDSAGVGSSDGDVPVTVEGMASYAIGLLRALDIKQADLLGFSLGSLVAQEVAFEQPALVHRIILVGSGPRGGEGMASLTPEFQALLAKKRHNPDDLLLDVFFTPSAGSQAAGQKFLARLHARQEGRDLPVSDKVAPAQVAAFAAWGRPQANSTDYLKQIKQPVLVVDGSHDIVHYPINSFTLEEFLPNSELIIYPDSNHGAQYQYPERFLTDATAFLDRKD
ncbi:alpha/beta fold hydrolase [Paraburkholderia fynbosensis]|uniref:Non-heme chloroperoxidase n=1 Tax=Paraburkholderia fynbosensis TaxID=1200993 RepID=A0A6J5H1T5_9BURK|nr:alpha/beta hydrolase [Paraburkholderia fynbosensis]CAB3810895.1 Non-heme chloroperoxidase [Paraburkholderia fynbosensis]